MAKGDGNGVRAGTAGDPRHTCNCAEPAIERYLGRVSGPLLDRIDIQVQVPPVVHRDLADRTPGEPSQAVRDRVTEARERQLRRYADVPGAYANAHIGPRELRRVCRITSKAEALLQVAMERLALSARAYHRILKIARTVADLAGEERVTERHVSEAVQYRNLDRMHTAGSPA